MKLKAYKAIERWSSELDGVFTLPDLKSALDTGSEPSLYRMITAMVEDGVLLKVKRGIYATSAASLKSISNRIDPAAYISTSTVLAERAVIGSVPAHRVQAVKVGRPRTYSCKLGTIEHLSVSSNLYFGFTNTSGLLVADAEKAFLDVCYFSYCGHRFSFDPVSDVNLSRLDLNKIELYLESYGARFITFFKRYWRL